MEISSVLGVIVGALAVCVGMIFKGASLGALVNPAAILIIFVGTAGALLNAFPMRNFTRAPTYFGLVFKGAKEADLKETAILFVNLSQLVRKEGVLVLEKQAESIEDQFLKDGVGMVADATEPRVLEDVLDAQITAMQDRHKDGALFFAQAGMYAPTLGVLGAVIGLVAALGNLNDIDALGHSIA
ncbi:MAG: MotA/TolQ/ExbB proton channel family protein, partial [Deferribacteraceae bacterium]|nr:MotA/TolQ/ExbB proton channel family protein [Deferribacteraceae bacterium]